MHEHELGDGLLLLLHRSAKHVLECSQRLVLDAQHRLPAHGRQPALVITALRHVLDRAQRSFLPEAVEQHKLLLQRQTPETAVELGTLLVPVDLVVELLRSLHGAIQGCVGRHKRVHSAGTSPWRFRHLVGVLFPRPRRLDLALQLEPLLPAPRGLQVQRHGLLGPPKRVGRELCSVICVVARNRLAPDRLSRGLHALLVVVRLLQPPVVLHVLLVVVSTTPTGVARRDMPHEVLAPVQHFLDSPFVSLLCGLDQLPRHTLGRRPLLFTSFWFPLLPLLRYRHLNPPHIRVVYCVH